ncbi:MAG: sigma-70 family RNA polymerase sigma factor [Chloroflexi bacterium]|nr:sigma-70 family RNA polymerase sigma factor [Chloroflexota bacterium]
MDQSQFLAERFEADRAHLRSVAYRLLGSTSDADDAVQETWLRLSRADTTRVENLTGWLTTVVARVSLDMLRSRTSRHEEQFGETVPEPRADHAESADPEHEAVLADSVGLALLVVLDTLGPAERLAFVLHDMFAVPFEEIASILGRSPAAAKQLASRARRRVQGAAPDEDIESDVSRQRAVVDAFLAASRAGDFDALLALLHPNAVLRADSTVVKRPRANLQPEVRGAQDVAGAFAGRAAGAQTALVDGFVGAVWAHGGRPLSVFEFRIAHGKIVSIDVVGDPERLGQLEVEVLA